MNAFKAKLRAREQVALVNANHTASSLVSFACGLGIDAVMIDCEQGNPGFEDIENMTRAARLAGTASIVRIPSVEPWTIERYMMRDVDGVVIPRLDTPEQVVRAIADIRYAVPRDFADKAIIVQVESAQAVASLDGFLAVPEVDCFFIGAVDLAKSMGHAGDYSHPDVMRTMHETVDRITAAGRAVGFLVKEHDLQHWRDRGVTMLYTHINAFLALGMREWKMLAHAPRAGT